MRYSPYSFSKLNLYLQCPFAWYCRYIKKLPEEKSPALIIGSAVHRVAELYLKHLKQVGKSSDLPALERFFKQEKDSLPSELQAEMDSYFDGLKGIALLSPKTGIEVPVAVDRNFNPVAFNSPHAFLRGKIDRIYGENGTVVITDWKSNRSMSTKGNDFERQLGIYALLALAFLKTMKERVQKIKVQVTFLRYSKTVEQEVSFAQLDKVKEYAFHVVSKIEAEQEWKPTPGKYCDWCSFVSCCPVAKRATELVEAPQEGISFEINTPEKASEAAQLYKVLGVLRQRLGEALKDYVTKNGGLEINGERLDFWPVKKVVWQTAKQKVALARLLKQAGIDDSQIWELFSTSQTRVQQVIRKIRRKDLLDAVLQTGSEEETTRFEFKKV